MTPAKKPPSLEKRIDRYLNRKLLGPPRRARRPRPVLPEADPNSTEQQLMLEQIKLLNKLVELQAKTERNTSDTSEKVGHTSDLIWLAVLWAAIAVMGLYVGMLELANAISGSRVGQMIGLDFGTQNEQADMGRFSSPIPGRTLEALIAYEPAFGQSFGPKTGNMRSYGPHAGIDYDCRIGGCAGGPIASPVDGVVEQIVTVATSVNGPSYQVEIVATDWLGPVLVKLTHVDNLRVKVGDRVRSGQEIAKVSPTDSISSGPHLHFELRRDGLTIDPQEWLRGAITTNSENRRKWLGGGGRNPEGGRGLALGIEGIKHFEGFHPEPYSDFAQCSHGFGTNAGGRPPNCPQTTISRDEAEAELVTYLRRNCLPKISPLALSAEQMAATLSLCYNIGPAQFEGSEVFAHARTGNHAAAANAFMNWTKASNTVLPGLITRRQKERSLYLRGTK